MYHAKDIDVNNIKIDNNIKNIDNKIKFSLITYNGGGPLVIQTPTLKMPYDFMSVYKADDKDDNSSIPKDIVASFGDYKNISSNKKFYDKMKEINELVVNHVINNKLIGHVSNTISKSSDEVVRAYSIPLVKPYIDKDTREESDKYPPTIKFRVKINNDTGLYDMDCSDMVSGNILTSPFASILYVHISSLTSSAFFRTKILLYKISYASTILSIVFDRTLLLVNVHNSCVLIT